MRVLAKQELQDIVTGAGLFGAGGGGSTAEGMKLVERVLEFGKGVKLATRDEISDEQWGAVIAGVGSPKASLTRVRTHSPTTALTLLEQARGFTSSFVVPFELGAGNSLNPMLAAIQRDIPIIDGDPAGRAVPEIQLSTFYLGGVPIPPLALATEDGISAVIRTEEPYDTERVARAITSELGGVSAIACHAMQGVDMKRHIIARHDNARAEDRILDPSYAERGRRCGRVSGSRKPWIRAGEGANHDSPRGNKRRIRLRYR